MQFEKANPTCDVIKTTINHEVKNESKMADGSPLLIKNTKVLLTERNYFPCPSGLFNKLKFKHPLSYSINYVSPCTNFMCKCMQNLSCIRDHWKSKLHF